MRSKPAQLFPSLQFIGTMMVLSTSWASAQQGDQAGAAQDLNRMQELEILYPEEQTNPRYEQVAPYPITEMRTSSHPISTQRHFTAEHKQVTEKTILTETFPEVDNQLSQLDPFFRDTSLELNIRSAFFRKETVAANAPLESTWALGGNLVYKSGWLMDFISIGAGYYTSSGLYKPLGQGGTKLLKNPSQADQGQHSQNVLGQAYVEFKYDIYRVKAWRQALDTPFINEHYDRMIPQLFEAYVIGTKTIQPDEKGTGLKYDKEYPVSFLAGYVTQELDRGSTKFNPMSSIATGNSTDKDRGVAFGGLQITPAEPVSIDLWNYYGVDMFNTFYAEGELDFALDRKKAWQAKLAVQFADQRSVGEEIAGNWSTQMVGLLAGTSYEGFSISFRYNYVFAGTGTAASGANRQFGFFSPWGRYPGFTKSTVSDFNRPQSSMYGIFLGYDFGKLNHQLQGLEFATSYVYEDRKQTGSAAGPDAPEFDIIIKYSPELVPGLSFDIRGSWISAYNTPANVASAPAVNDYRVTVNYTIPLL